MYFVFAKTREMFVFPDNGKNTNRNIKINIVWLWSLRYDEMSSKRECEFWRNWYWAFNRKKWWILMTVRNINLRSISNKILLSSVKKSKFSFSGHLQINKKVNNVKEDPQRKTDSDFRFFPSSLVLSY